MKKRFFALFIVFAAFLLVGCAQNKLSESFDEDEVKLAAQDVIARMNEKDYAGVVAMVREDLQEALSVEVLTDAADLVLVDTGEFESYTNEFITGQKDKTTGEDYAIAIMATKYANKKVVYTISFDVDMKIVGFYLK